MREQSCLRSRVPFDFAGVPRSAVGVRAIDRIREAGHDRRGEMQAFNAQLADRGVLARDDGMVSGQCPGVAASFDQLIDAEPGHACAGRDQLQSFAR